MRVFLSYASEDRAFATRLRDALLAAGVDVFFDAWALNAGEQWEKALDDELEKVAGLVCLWSNNARESDWVPREVHTYMAKVRREKKGKAILIRLDDRENSFGSTQHINNDDLKRAFAAQTPEAFSFGSIASELAVAFATRGNLSQVPVVLFTLTSGEVSQLGAHEKEMLQRRFALDDASMASRYGQERLDWKPFPNGDKIRNHLDRALHSINLQLRKRPIEWEYPPEAFWVNKDGEMNQEAVRQFAARVMSAEAGIVVVDPAAVAYSVIRDRLGLFHRCARSHSVAIIALHLSDATPQGVQFHNWLVTHANAVLEPYVDPNAKEMPTARFGIGLTGIEFDRFVKSSVFGSLGAAINEPAASYTKF